MRMTHATVQVAQALMDDSTGRHWGYDLGKKARVRSGVLYPILRRMLDDGLLEDGWEDEAEIIEKRPPRRYYTLTPEGMSSLGALLAASRRDERFGALTPRLAR